MADQNNRDTSYREEVIRLRTQMEGVDQELGKVKLNIGDRVNEVKRDLKEEIKEVKTDLKSDLQNVKTDLHNRITRLEGRIQSNITIAVTIGSVATSAIVTVIVAILNSLKG